MWPVLFRIDGFTFYSYGFMLAVGFLVAAWLGAREAEREGISWQWVFDLTLVLCISAIVGARLVYVITELPWFIKHPREALSLSGGGLSFFGGFGFALATGIAFARRSRVSAWVMADIAAPYVALAYAIARVGCFLNGCCYGTPSELPWAIPRSPQDLIPRHPTQIYASLGSLAIFAILLAIRRGRHFPGFRMFLYVGLYSVMRFVVEIFRDVPRILGPLSLAQIVCIPAFLLAIAGIGVLSATWREGRSNGTWMQ